MDFATLRTKATLEACLGAACDRNRVRAEAIDAIGAVLSFGLSAQAQADAIRAELDKLPALLADIDAQFNTRGAIIDATRYPDEDEE